MRKYGNPINNVYGQMPEETDEDFLFRMTGKRQPIVPGEVEDPWWGGIALVIMGIIALAVLFVYFQSDLGQAQNCGMVEWRPCP